MRTEPGRISGARLIGCGWFLLAGLAGPALAEESGPRATVPTDPVAIGIEPPDRGSPWLDEVRAQREAWESRRAASREYHEQRRRAYHSRGAVQPDAWEEDLRRRRAERQERIDQDREVFRRLGPGAWGPPSTFAEDEREHFERPEAGSPPGWDNLWYFRGY
ncbi:MAG: hypothetical protein MZV65_27660 [Chromatiales bacterium]|nr:hypothetical protein [Chromatiales bacterium]